MFFCLHSHLLIADELKEHLTCLHTGIRSAPVSSSIPISSPPHRSFTISFRPPSHTLSSTASSSGKAKASTAGTISNYTIAAATSNVRRRGAARVEPGRRDPQLPVDARVANVADRRGHRLDGVRSRLRLPRPRPRLRRRLLAAAAAAHA
jgi:hypothetical protein